MNLKQAPYQRLVPPIRSIMTTVPVAVPMVTMHQEQARQMVLGMHIPRHRSIA